MTETTVDNRDGEGMSVRNTEKGVSFSWITPRYEEGVPDEESSHTVFNIGDMEQLTRSGAAVIDWLRDYEERGVVNDCDLLLFENEAYIYLLKVREHGEIFDIIQKGDFEKLEARWSLFDYYDRESGFLFSDIEDAIEFMRGMADACLAYRHLLREPRAEQ